MFMKLFRRNERASINRELDHLYRELREVQEKTRLIKQFADQRLESFKEESRQREQQLIARAQQIDAADLNRSIPARSARSW